ncbi:MAG: glycine--tRNA ligase subunit alpha, partial [Alphaproteobacteria bacterium]
CMKAILMFNRRDARGVIWVTDRSSYIARVRALAKGCCEAWIGQGAASAQEGSADE